jgi:protein phosphatase
MIARGMIQPEEAETHPESHKITRAVGYQDEIRLDFRTLRVLPGDRYILCSDGLHKEVDDSGILDAASAATSADDACERLLHRTLETRARDNVTIVVIDFSKAS